MDVESVSYHRGRISAKLAYRPQILDQLGCSELLLACAVRRVKRCFL
jgi:hypothetical protein